MSTDTPIQNLVINKLTQAQYDAATKSPTEFYIVTDGKEAISDIEGLETALAGKQPLLVSGTNIKTINDTTILGSGNISVATAAQGAKADTALQTTDIIDNLTSTATDKALSANQGKELLSYMNLIVGNEETARKNADISLRTDINSISNTIATYGDVVTHDADEFATSAQGAKADSALQQSDIIDNLTSTATNKALSANQGKQLAASMSEKISEAMIVRQW